MTSAREFPPVTGWRRNTWCPDCHENTMWVRTDDDEEWVFCTNEECRFSADTDEGRDYVNRVVEATP